MRSIVAASDLTDVKEDGLRGAAGIAARTGAALHALHGTGAVGLTLREAVPHLTPAAQRRLLDDLRERARDACSPFGVHVAACHLSHHDTMDALPSLSHELEAGLVVVGASILRRPTGVAAIGRLLRSISCPLLIARPGSPPPFRSVLVPVGFGDLGSRTLQAACEWLIPLHENGRAKRILIDLHVLHVAPGLRGWREAGAVLDQAVREAEVLMWGTARLHEHVRWSAHPAQRILESATNEECELIILRPDRRQLSDPVVRTWETVAIEARCSVLLIPSARSRTSRGELVQSGRPVDLEPVLAS